MNQTAYDAIERAWALTVKTRELCPRADISAIGPNRYLSRSWYRKGGVIYVVDLARALSNDDVQDLNQISNFVNRSFVVFMAAIMEEHEVLPHQTDPDLGKAGGKHVHLTRRLRNRFAHGDWQYDPGNSRKVETRKLVSALFPAAIAEGPDIVTSLDDILEPLKDGVLDYIRAAT